MTEKEIELANDLKRMANAFMNTVDSYSQYRRNVIAKYGEKIDEELNPGYSNEKESKKMMRLITGPRCSGKTTTLMEESAQTGIPIITPTMMMANHISMLAKEQGLDIPEPTSINKVANRGRPGKYLVDELEMCLRQLGIDPVAATMWDGTDMKARDLD